ncbi:MAG: hypothetical protein KAY59_05015 [Acidobacteria bacterium]|nr:hypothetical protein [Acidobacteriota bacterium]
MTRADDTLAPQGVRIFIAFVGCFAAAGIPIAIPLALGLTVSGDAVWVLLAVVLVYSVFYLYLIGRLGQWAARIEPAEGVAPLPLGEVRRRLLALNESQSSFHVYDEGPDHLVVEWATRGPQARATRRVHIRFDGARHCTRVVEIHTQMTWTAARALPRWRGSFRFFRGIELGTSDAKRPVIATIVHAGWAWQPRIFG